MTCPPPAPTACSPAPTAHSSTCTADKGYGGGDGRTLLTPDQGRTLTTSTRDAHRCHAAIRAPGERGFAVLKSWKVFDRFP